mgnify:CR=1 FL=1
MDWLEAVVHTTTMGADIVSEVLMNAGAVGTAIEDKYDVTSSKKSDGMWDMIDEDVLKHMSDDVLVKAYFKSDASAAETLHLVGEKLADIAKMDMGFDIGSLKLDTQALIEQIGREKGADAIQTLPCGRASGHQAQLGEI